jgi:hypothetical protein
MLLLRVKNIRFFYHTYKIKTKSLIFYAQISRNCEGKGPLSIRHIYNEFDWF